MWLVAAILDSTAVAQSLILHPSPSSVPLLCTLENISKEISKPTVSVCFFCLPFVSPSQSTVWLLPPLLHQNCWVTNDLLIASSPSLFLPPPSSVPHPWPLPPPCHHTLLGFLFPSDGSFSGSLLVAPLSDLRMMGLLRDWSWLLFAVNTLFLGNVIPFQPHSPLMALNPICMRMTPLFVFLTQPFLRASYSCPYMELLIVLPHLSFPPSSPSQSVAPASTCL